MFSFSLFSFPSRKTRRRAFDFLSFFSTFSPSFSNPQWNNQILVDLAELQDQEVGDGTTSVVILAAELLRRGAELVRAAGVHPTAVISGYRRAARDACAFVRDELAIPVATLGDDALAAVARTSMSSKVIGGGGKTTEHFAALLVDAVKAVRTERIEGGASSSSTSVVKYPVSAVTVLKARGGSLLDSQLIRGVALNLGKAAAGMPSRVGKAKEGASEAAVARIACLDVNLQKARMHLGVQVLITDPSELEAIRAREADIAKERVATILAAGANVVFTTKGIDDLCLKYFVEAGVMAARRVPKDALRRVAKATGATLVTSLADEEGGEAFDASCLGTADAVVEENVAGDDIIVVRGGHGGKKRRKEAAASAAAAASDGNGGEVSAASASASAATANDDEEDDDDVLAEGGGATLLLRGANDYLLDEAERAAHDAMCVVRRVLESGSVVPGGGAAEAAISVFLERCTPSLAPREQLAVAEAAEAVLAVPRALASNAARDGADLVAKLRAYHFKAQKAAEDKKAGKSGEQIEEDLLLGRCGLDLENGLVRDSVAAGVLEPAGGKISALRFAAEAAITILRIDDLIRVEPAGDEQ